MKNLSPHRRFRGASYIEPLRGNHYQRPWPEDLPEKCQICGTKFRAGFNISVGPNRIGRFLRKWANLSFLPCMLGAFGAPLLFDGAARDWFNEYGGWYFFSMLLAPGLLGFASFLTPITRLLECKKCGWNQDYPAPKTTPLPTAAGNPR